MDTELNHTHVYESSPALPYDGGIAGPAAGGVVYREWCTAPGCYHARRVYCSAGFSETVPARHPRKDANIRVAQRRARIEAQVPITLAPGREMRIADTSGARQVERILVHTSWAGEVWISAGAALAAASEHAVPAIREAYAQLVHQASEIGIA